MSLINEALKEAQREAHERSGRQTRAEVADTFFPYPEKLKNAQARPLSTQTITIAAASLAVLLIVGAALFYPREKSGGAGASTLAAPKVPVPVAMPTVASRPSGVAPISVVPPISIAAPAAAARQPSERARVPSPPTVERPSRAELVVAAVPTNEPSKIAQPPAKAAGVGVVIEGVAARPGDSLFTQAYAEQSRGNFDHAKELYERLIAQPQASADAFNNLGVLLLQTGDRIGAAEMFKQALARDDRSVNAWVNLGDSYNAIGHHAEAMSAFARASQLDESSVAVKIRLAAEYEAIGDSASARREYDRALERAPSDPSVHYSFGKFLQAQHDVRGAVREYQLFVDLAPGKYSTENIDLMRKYIVALGRQAR